MKTIQFTPHAYGWAYFVGEPFASPGYYTEMQRRANLNGVGDYLRANKLYLFSSGIRKPILTNQTHPEQSYHFTKINQAGIIENVSSQKGLSYLLCKEFAEKAYGNRMRKTFISENGQGIQDQVDAWYLGENWQEKEAVVGRDYIHQVGDIFWLGFWFNGGTLTFDVPEGLEFIGRDLNSQHYNYDSFWSTSGGGFTYAKVFDQDYTVSGNTVTIEITPTELFHVNPKTGEFTPEEKRMMPHNPYYAGPGIMQRKGITPKLRTIGAFQFKALTPGEYYLPFANGYIKVEGEAAAQPELINVNLASEEELWEIHGVGESIARNIVVTRSEKTIADEKDLERVPRIGPKTGPKIAEQVTFEL